MSLKKIFLAILSGIMLTASFPPGRMGWMAWIAIIPLLISLKNEGSLNRFKLGIIAGLAHYSTLLYWIIFVINHYGEIDLFTSSAILLLLCLYLSLYPAVFSLSIRLMKRRGFKVVMIAGIWVFLEYVRGVLMTGFPWCLLGYSQFNYQYIIQISDITGVYGISFLIVAFNYLAYILIFDKVKSNKRNYLYIETIIVTGLLLISIFYGKYRISEDKGKKNEKGAVKISVIQGNIDQSVKWDPAFMESTMNKYIGLTRSTFDHKPDVIIWPESAAPFFFQDGNQYSRDICGLAEESGSWIIFGCPAYEERDSHIAYFNRVCLISPIGSLTGFYDKKHLVPFGEYVPLKKFIPFVNRLVISQGEFAPGKGSGVLKLNDIAAGVLVCYEAIFPDLARREVKNGAMLFVNLTNDAWFGMTSAPYQHLSMCVFRAVENRIPLVRAANTGFSAFIDPFGRIYAKSGLFTEEVLTNEVRTDYSRLTFYSRYGDIFVFLILIICLIKFSYDLCYHFIEKRRF